VAFMLLIDMLCLTHKISDRLIELTYQYFFQDFCIHAAVPPGQWTKD
jgi:hypothetical protein